MTAGQVEGLSLGASTTTTLAAVIVVSDEVATGLDDDRAGPVALDLLQGLGLRTTLAVVGDADADNLESIVTERGNDYLSAVL